LFGVSVGVASEPCTESAPSAEFVVEPVKAKVIYARERGNAVRDSA
jgi:hypothetical protein